MTNFYKPSTYNAETKQQMWMSVISDFHDSMCRCTHPFAHCLAIIFPEGHRDRHKTIQEIIDRDSQCHFGGEEEQNLGWATAIKEEDLSRREEGEEYIKDEDLQEIITAAAAVTEENTR